MPTHRRDIVVIGASAGGWPALQQLCGALPANLAAAVFIVFHVHSSSPGVLAQTLDQVGPLPASAGTNGGKIEPGHIYVAPPDRHMLLTPRGIALADGPRENRFRPAIDPLFRSAARSFANRVVGVILTGALDDGTEGLMYIKRAGGVTIVQDPGEASVAEMPENAIEHVGPDHVLQLEQIASLIVELTQTDAPNVAAQEVTSTMADSSDIDNDLRPKEISGPPTAISCPECNGAIWKTEEGNLTRYQCHVGHIYTEQAMVDAKSEELEIALWTALRALKEAITMYRTVAERARAGGRNLSA